MEVQRWDLGAYIYSGGARQARARSPVDVQVDAGVTGSVAEAARPGGAANATPDSAPGRCRLSTSGCGGAPLPRHSHMQTIQWDAVCRRLWGGIGEELGGFESGGRPGRLRRGFPPLGLSAGRGVGRGCGGRDQMVGTALCLGSQSWDGGPWLCVPCWSIWGQLVAML